jgi:fructose-bisphosphate aldolase class II
MPLVSILDELKKGQEAQYAIPCFDTFEMAGTDGIVAALEAKRAPGIVGLWSGLLDRPNGRAVVNYVRTVAQSATVPVSLILDHGSSYEHCIKALAWGFSDVMYDGSRLPFEENIAITRTIVQAAHALGACVEAELGHVGRGSEYQSFGARRMGFTQPDAVERFVTQTGVDFLAVAIGTAHGLYEGDPAIDLDLLREIRRRVDIPLVLHGGSGLSDQQFRAAIDEGISKINIFTNLARAAGARMIEVAHGEDASYFGLIRAAAQAFQEECEQHIELFGASGRA